MVAGRLRLHPSGHRRGATCSPRPTGVSLIEVLVVMSIVVFLLALLVPGLYQAKERARRVQCANNLRQWGFALQFYRDENADYIPMEGSSLPKNWIHVPGTWFNVLPPYLDMPAYGDIEGANISIREFKNGHIWVCPSKDLTGAFKSFTGKNQFHYAMNQVLDGMGARPGGSRDTPGFPDPEEARPVPAKRFLKHPRTVMLFDIAPNSPSGSPRDVATESYRDFAGRPAGKFHGDFANLLCLDGSVAGISAGELFSPRDNRAGAILWSHSEVYWGYPPPR